MTFDEMNLIVKEAVVAVVFIIVFIIPFICDLLLWCFDLLMRKLAKYKKPKGSLFGSCYMSNAYVICSCCNKVTNKWSYYFNGKIEFFNCIECESKYSEGELYYLIKRKRKKQQMH